MKIDVIKKCAPKLVLFNEKKLRKIPMIFDVENWLWKSNFGTFWHVPTTPILKIQWFYLTIAYSWFVGKNLSNFLSPDLKLHNPYCHKKRAQNVITKRRGVRKPQILRNTWIPTDSCLFGIQIAQNGSYFSFLALFV